MWIKLEIQAKRATEKQTERKALKERRSVSKRVTKSACVWEREREEREEGGERGERRERREGQKERERDRETEREREPCMANLVPGACVPPRSKGSRVTVVLYCFIQQKFKWLFRKNSEV